VVYHGLQDECRSWDVNDIVFSPALWPTYHHLMRSDFQLFDEYVYEHEGEFMAVRQMLAAFLAHGALHDTCWVVRSRPPRPCSHAS
jgi:hypothetical protein